MNLKDTQRWLESDASRKHGFTANELLAALLLADLELQLRAEVYAIRLQERLRVIECTVHELSGEWFRRTVKHQETRSASDYMNGRHAAAILEGDIVEGAGIPVALALRVRLRDGAYSYRLIRKDAQLVVADYKISE